METQQVRRDFLKYFKGCGHAEINSSPVCPHDDPTLLFINAGMNQFKDVFLGKSARDYNKATTVQKCIRVGGKHNDLENVGHTSRHLTFFEMLGNFSFGDYFKEETIRYAWEVSTEVFKFEPEKIFPTVFREDDEAFEIWKKYVPESRITRFDEKDNFWAMGDTGPCGPSTELFYDRGSKYGSGRTPKEDPEGLRYLEFWNLVFMQYNRTEEGILVPLPKPSVDTGSGLERVISLKMDVESVFETDVLRSLIAQTEEVSGIKYDQSDVGRCPAFRVIADHLRTLSFAIADGVQPSNIDRGYVLRKVLRRAVRYGRTLGMEKPFLAKIFPRLLAVMGEDYPELVKSEERIKEILTLEEESFLKTLQRGGNIMNQIVTHAKEHGKVISGDEAFKLKDTYGLPIDEILLLAKDAALTVDTRRYEELELEAKERSRTAHKVTRQTVSENLFSDFVNKEGTTLFVGYQATQAEGTVKAIVVDGQFVDSLQEGQEGMIVLDQTPFYAEMGGQIGDSGQLGNSKTRINVLDCIAPYKGIVGHVCECEKGIVHIGDKLDAIVNAERRQKIANNHTATHLLHWALHKVLGDHVKQAGSVVDESRLRFDFSHHKSLTKEEIRAIEDLVNQKIRENLPVNAYELSYQDVQKREDIKQFFGDKYDALVRVIDIDFSKELCGGTHTSAIGNIGLFRIAKEGSIAAGVRRIEAVTGTEAEALVRATEDLIEAAAEKLKAAPNKLTERIEKLLEENRKLAQELKEAKKRDAEGEMEQLLAKVETANGMKLLIQQVNLPPKELNEFADALLEKMGSGVLVLGSTVEADKCQMIAKVSDDHVQKGIKAVEIIKSIAPIVNGGGGGKADSAQAGGKAPENINAALLKARELFCH